jgi:hypothetical protein
MTNSAEPFFKHLASRIMNKPSTRDIIAAAEHDLLTFGYCTNHAVRSLIDALKAAELREQAGRDYLVSICGIGSEDPMDFLISAHAWFAAENAELKKQLNDEHTHDK